MFPVLETARLRLREITAGDTSSIYSFFRNEDVTRFYGQEPIQSEEQAEAFIQFFSANFAEKRGIRWGIERKDTGGLIGTIGFHGWATQHRRTEIGYELHPDFWGYGFISEALSAAVSYGFTEMGLNRIGAVVFLENEASSNVLLKAGFEKEGILRGYMQQNGTAYDTFVYSLLRDQWEESR